MCGFAVLVTEPAAQAHHDAAVAAIPECLHALSGRGPDSVGLHVDTGLVAACTRLAQWNEGRCEQPLVTPEGGFAVFNGELFNLEELRTALGRETLSEVEVLLEGVAAEGARFLDRVDGQFAAVVRPRAGADVLFARDRFGICPLFVAEDTGVVAAASTISALRLLLPQVGREIDVQAVVDVMTQWSPQAGRTVFTGARLLGPGARTLVRQGDSGMRLLDVTDSAPAPEPVRAQLDQTDVDDLENRVRSSVTTRMRCAGDVATLVSGGVDSTVVAAMARTGGVRRALSLVLQGDDATAAAQDTVAAALDLRLDRLELTPAMVLDELVHHVRTRTSVLARLGPVGMSLLARRAREAGISAVLSGEGADELFAGYDHYRVLAARAGVFGPPESLSWQEFGPSEAHGGEASRWHSAYWRNAVALDRPGEPGVATRARIVASLAHCFRPSLRALLDADTAARYVTSPTELRRHDIEHFLSTYLLITQADSAWSDEGVELRPVYLARDVAAWALSRHPDDFVRIDRGKLPIRLLLERQAETAPALARMDLPKAAFRIDAAFLMGDPESASRLREWVARCPDSMVDVGAVLTRFDACARARRASEGESVMFLMAASLGILDAEAGANWTRR